MSCCPETGNEADVIACSIWCCGKVKRPLGFEPGDDGFDGLGAGVRIEGNGRRDFSGATLPANQRPALGALEHLTAGTVR